MAVRVKIDFPDVNKLLRDKGLTPDGDVQMFVTQNVLRRIYKYMPKRSGVMRDVTVVQTPTEITTITPYAEYVYNGVSKSGKPLNYTTPGTGPEWDKTLIENEMGVMTSEAQAYIDHRGG